MVYSSKAVLPSDIAFGAPRIQNYDQNEAGATRCTDIDSAEEHRLTALLALLKYPFYPLFILDNGMNLISKSLTVLTPA